MALGAIEGTRLTQVLQDCIITVIDRIDICIIQHNIGIIARILMLYDIDIIAIICCMIQ